MKTAVILLTSFIVILLNYSKPRLLSWCRLRPTLYTALYVHVGLCSKILRELYLFVLRDFICHATFPLVKAISFGIFYYFVRRFWKSAKYQFCCYCSFLQCFFERLRVQRPWHSVALGFSLKLIMQYADKSMWAFPVSRTYGYRKTIYFKAYRFCLLTRELAVGLQERW